MDKFKWRRSFGILFGKLWYVALIIVATQIDYMLVEAGKDTPITVTNATVVALAGYDISRFLENLKGFGINVPAFLLNMMKKITENMNKG